MNTQIFAAICARRGTINSFQMGRWRGSEDQRVKLVHTRARAGGNQPRPDLVLGMRKTYMYMICRLWVNN